MGAHIQNLEAGIDNIWEDFVKLAQGTYSVSYIHYHPIWASWQIEWIWNSQVQGPSF